MGVEHLQRAYFSKSIPGEESGNRVSGPRKVCMDYTKAKNVASAFWSRPPMTSNLILFSVFVSAALAEKHRLGGTHASGSRGRTSPARPSEAGSW